MVPWDSVKAYLVESGATAPTGWSVGHSVIPFEISRLAFKLSASAVCICCERQAARRIIASSTPKRPDSEVASSQVGLQSVNM